MTTSTLFTCVKNEESYLLEWIAFHKICGFDEIIIYDNGSTDNTRDLLQPLARHSEIVYRLQSDDEKVGPQILAFRDAARTCTNTWLMLMDADEFLVFNPYLRVNDFLSRFGPEVSQVSVNWRLFGSGGQKRRTDGFVIERFQMASIPGNPLNAHVKSFIRPERFQSAHVHAAYTTGGLGVNADGDLRWMKSQGLTTEISHRTASVHHYIVKSREEFDKKMARGRGTFAVGSPKKFRADPGRFFSGHDLNEVHEAAALAQVDAVKAEFERLAKLASR